jgi:YNFM family putative membrane transporter
VVVFFATLYGLALVIALRLSRLPPLVQADG